MEGNFNDLDADWIELKFSEWRRILRSIESSE